MRKNLIKCLFLMLVILFSAGGLAACHKKAEPIFLTIDGDIAGGMTVCNLAERKKEDYRYNEDGEEKKGEGWRLNDALAAASPEYTNNQLMLTAKDGVSALLAYPLTGTIFIYQNEENKLCVKGIDYPKAVNLKDIAEITFITTDAAADGYKVLTPGATILLSRGNAKRKLFDFVVENKAGDQTADKYIAAADRSVAAFTGRNKNIVYFEDYDIKKNASLEQLYWQAGKLMCGGKSVFGFATGTDTLILDAFQDMKTALENGKRVLFILPDGFSLEQANTYAEELSVLKPGSSSVIAASTHLSISPVALAAIVTGRTPYENGVYFDEGESRAVLAPKTDDIFKYAADAGKSAAYLEGSGNLIVTTIQPQYATSDYVIYQNAQRAIADGKDLIFVHFHEIDDTNHAYGALSPQAKTKLLITEGYINHLMAGFDGTVIIVSDHGHNTLLDVEGKPYGKHGLFTALDMYVPYYRFEV